MRKSVFKGRVSKNAKSEVTKDGGYKYISLPEGIKMYVPTPGEKEKFDIIPYIISDKNHSDYDHEENYPTPGDIWYKRPFKIHTDVGGDGQKVVCLTTFGKKCPICEHRKVRAKKGDDKEDLKPFYSKSRDLYVVIPIDNENYEEEPYVLDMSYYLFQEKLKEETEENEDYEIFPELEDGLTLEVSWRKKTWNKGKPYAEARRINFIERDKDYDEKILKKVPDLDKCLIEISYEKMSALFYEESNDVADLDQEINDHSKDEDKSERKSKSFKKDKKEKETKSKSKDLNWEDLEDMDAAECAEVIDNKGLSDDIDIEDYEDDEKGLRKVIAEELDIEISKKKSKIKDKDKKESKSKKECPYGHRFGIDTDKTKFVDDCDKCVVWEACDKIKQGG